MHKKPDVNLFFTTTSPETGQIPGINKVFERQVWRVQVAHLHKAARASPSFPILSVCPLIDDKTSQSAREKLDSYCKIVVRAGLIYKTKTPLIPRQLVSEENR